MAFNQRLFSVKLSNSFQSFKHWKELRRITAQKREVLLVSFSDFAHFVFAIINVDYKCFILVLSAI